MDKELTWLPFSSYRNNTTVVTGLNAYGPPAISLTLNEAVNYLRLDEINVFTRVFDDQSRNVPFLNSMHNILLSSLEPVSSPLLAFSGGALRPTNIPFGAGANKIGMDFRVTRPLAAPAINLYWNWAVMYGWGSPDGVAPPIMNFYTPVTLTLQYLILIKGSIAY